MPKTALTSYKYIRKEVKIESGTKKTLDYEYACR